MAVASTAAERPLLSAQPFSHDLGHPQEFASRLCLELEKAHLVHVEGPAPDSGTLAQWEKVVSAIGAPVYWREDSGTGVRIDDLTLWTDVRYRAELQHTFRHSCTAQPLHTDGAYDAVPSDITVFVCEQDAASGGESIFVRAADVAETARKVDAQLYDNLFTVPLPYGKAGSVGRTVPILTPSDDGLLLNWNYYRVLKSYSSAVHDLAERFRRFLEQDIVQNGVATKMTLHPGEALFFEDQHVLHGRAAFAPGPRCLWKCSVNRATG